MSNEQSVEGAAVAAPSSETKTKRGLEREAQALIFWDKIRNAWAADTSVDPDWTPDNPALGQCAVTACLVQEAMGGELLRCTVDLGSHYWNLLPGGVEVDLTREQFPPHAYFGEPETRSREYVLSFPETARRYELLRKRVLG